ncbi:Protein gts1 [Ophidiomyces ophidiicola]|nr:Protein gts1 [Ophidiomyces ophidiicola]
MASALSKRQQARNERALQDLLKSVAGNDRCADCHARNPGKLSRGEQPTVGPPLQTNKEPLGLTGAALSSIVSSMGKLESRRLPVYAVKSLSMDSWSQDQVDNMKRNGNAVVNGIYNPKNIRPPIPIDADEADSAMERFIRQKYESKVLEDGKPRIPSREDPSYISKPIEDSPPPLPPKPSRRFGFGLRSSSSHSGLNKASPRRESFGSTSIFSNNKPSRSLGFNVDDSNGSFETKLGILRNMGFPDDKRNATVLRGLNGDVDRTVDALVRLGERSGPTSRSRTPVLKSPTSVKFPDTYDCTATPMSSTNPFDKMGSSSSRSSAGISINRRESQGSSIEEVAAKKQTSYNPFDVPPPQSSAAPSLEQSFQNLQVSQPLFPNMTGGYPSQQAQASLRMHQQCMTPPVTMTSQGAFTTTPGAINGGHNPFFQSPPPVNSAAGTFAPPAQNLSPSNPFFSQSMQSNFQPQIPNSHFAQASPAHDGFPLQHANTMPIISNSPFYTPQQQQQQQQLGHQMPQSAPITPIHSSPVPYFQGQYSQQAPQPQPFQPPQPSRMDKSSILALYTFSKPPPTILEQPQQQPQLQPDPTTAPSQPPFNQPAPVPSSAPPVSHNPFFTAPNANAALPPATNPGMMASAKNGNVPFVRSHMSQESMDIRRAQNGRHSPDVFASLSARYGQ